MWLYLLSPYHTWRLFPSLLPPWSRGTAPKDSSWMTWNPPQTRTPPHSHRNNQTKVLLISFFHKINFFSYFPTTLTKRTLWEGDGLFNLIRLGRFVLNEIIFKWVHLVLELELFVQSWGERVPDVRDLQTKNPITSALFEKCPIFTLHTTRCWGLDLCLTRRGSCSSSRPGRWLWWRKNWNLIPGGGWCGFPEWVAGLKGNLRLMDCCWSLLHGGGISCDGEYPWDVVDEDWFYLVIKSNASLGGLWISVGCCVGVEPKSLILGPWPV